MAHDGTVLTQDGYERLCAELERLRLKRVEVVETIRVTREDGDLKENFPYHAARHELGILQGQIGGIEQKLATATILKEGQSLDEIVIGIPFTVKVDETGEEISYTIVDGSEVDHVQNGVSADGPIGEALLYCRVGDPAEVDLPSGMVKLTVLSIGE